MKVLSNLAEDGSRIAIKPRAAKGRFWRRRAVVAYTLIALFVALPLVRIGGRPAFLIDLGARRVDLFGAVFRPSDGASLMLLGLVIVLAVFLVTTLWGRVWCGWACPQTVYLEWVFRPLERRIKNRALRMGTYAAIAVVLAHVFLAYFVPIETLLTWTSGSPASHPVGFSVVAAVSVGMFLDFAWFREYMCTVACPYGRLQSVLLDRQSLIVGYDAHRGEPRGKVRLNVVGDCVDCRACVKACPTGIDIREGLQMECVTCAQCVDACDAIMDRLGRPRGLIRYASQDELAGAPRKVIRPRTVLYPALLAIALGLLVWQVGGRPAAEVWVMRAEGTPFVVLDDGRVSTMTKLRIENRGEVARDYRVMVIDAPDAELLTPRAPIAIEAGTSAQIQMVVVLPRAAFRDGERTVSLRVADDAGWQRDVALQLLGPEVSP